MSAPGCVRGRPSRECNCAWCCANMRGITREIPAPVTPKIIAPPAFLKAAATWWMAKNYAARDKARFEARLSAIGRNPTKDDTEAFDALIVMAIDEINRAAWAFQMTYSEAHDALHAYLNGCDVPEARKRIAALPDFPH